jgi:arylsulfatase A-like enzyme
VRNQPKLKDNTLILVCSDNGPEAGAGSAGPFRGGKTMLYEGGIRSPLIAWGPGLINSKMDGQHNNASVFCALDVVPSLLSLAGVQPPASVAFDGENLADTLVGKSTASRKSPIFWRRPPDRPGDAGENLPDLAVRDGQWKMLCEYDGSAPQLYNLASDRGETTNVAADHADIVQRLAKSVLAWHKSMPPDNGPQYAPAPVGQAKARGKMKTADK